MQDKDGQTKLSPRQFSLFKNYINKNKFIQDFPIFLIIEPTNNCNFDCIMCPRPNMTRPIGNMSLDLFKKIIDEYKIKSNSYGCIFLVSP